MAEHALNIKKEKLYINGEKKWLKIKLKITLKAIRKETKAMQTPGTITLNVKILTKIWDATPELMWLGKKATSKF